MLEPEKVIENFNEILRTIMRLKLLWNQTAESARVLDLSKFPVHAQKMLSRSGIQLGFFEGVTTLLGYQAQLPLEEMFIPVRTPQKTDEQEPAKQKTQRKE